MMDQLDEEIAELQRGWAEQELEAERARREAHLEQRKRFRARVRRGDAPEHLKKCAPCLRAVLEPNTDLACFEGKHHPNLWN